MMSTAFVDNAFNKRYANTIADTTSGFNSGLNGAPGAVGSTWRPPRDAFRYFGARVDVSF